MEKEHKNFSWFPGHMRKAMRLLEEQLGLADIVLLVLDARLPLSSRQPDLEKLLRQRQKEVIFVLNKADLAEERETNSWLKWFASQKLEAVAMRSTSGRGAGPLEKSIAKVRQKIQVQRQAKGMLPRDPRLVVAGVPNVGKSSLLNRLAGANRAQTGARPGVTRGNQWVAVPGKWQILDSPGILYPKIESEETLMILAAASCVRHDAIPLELVGGLLLERLWSLHKIDKIISEKLRQTWQESAQLTSEGMLDDLARSKFFYLNTDEPDLIRASRYVLKAFVQGELGRVTLEKAPRSNE